MEVEIRLLQLYRMQGDRDVSRSTIHQYRIPINLQIRGNANSLRTRRKFPCEIRNHRARKPRWEAHIVDHLHPFALSILHFHVGRSRLHSSL